MLKKIMNTHHNEDGFTLIELLVVILIIGILAAVAVPVFLNQRVKAAETSVKSDLKNASIAMETDLVANRGAYPSVLPESVTTSEGVELKLANNAKNLEDADGWISFTATPMYITATEDIKLSLKIEQGALSYRADTPVPSTPYTIASAQVAYDCGNGFNPYTSSFSFAAGTTSAQHICYPNKLKAARITPDDAGHMKIWPGYRINESFDMYEPGKGLNVEIQPGDNKRYCIEGSHENTKVPTWHYDSLNGGMSEGKCSV